MRVVCQKEKECSSSRGGRVMQAGTPSHCPSTHRFLHSALPCDHWSVTVARTGNFFQPQTNTTIYRMVPLIDRKEEKPSVRTGRCVLVNSEE